VRKATDRPGVTTMNALLRYLGAAVLLLWGVSSAAGQEQGVELRWRFKKGQTFKYLLKHREVRTVEVAKQKFETTTASEYEWTWTVKDVDDKGAATLEHKFTAIRVTATGKDLDFQYDSSGANQSSDAYNKDLINLYDQLRFAGKYKVQLTPDGRVASVQG